MGRRSGLKIRGREACGFESRPGHQRPARSYRRQFTTPIGDIESDAHSARRPRDNRSPDDARIRKHHKARGSGVDDSGPRRVVNTAPRRTAGFRSVSQPTASVQASSNVVVTPAFLKSWNRASMPAQASHARARLTVSQLAIPKTVTGMLEARPRVELGYEDLQSSA